MRVGDSIREIREVEKSFKRSYVAKQLRISTRAYSNIENNVTDITLKRLQEIASILGCSSEYILHYKRLKSSYSNWINGNGKRGVIEIYQGGNCEVSKTEELLKELLQCERKRINLLEALLRNNNINF